MEYSRMFAFSPIPLIFAQNSRKLRLSLGISLPLTVHPTPSCSIWVRVWMLGTLRLWPVLTKWHSYWLLRMFNFRQHKRPWINADHYQTYLWSASSGSPSLPEQRLEQILWVRRVEKAEYFFENSHNCKVAESFAPRSQSTQAYRCFWIS